MFWGTAGLIIYPLMTMILAQRCRKIEMGETDRTSSIPLHPPCPGLQWMWHRSNECPEIDRIINCWVKPEPEILTSLWSTDGIDRILMNDNYQNIAYNIWRMVLNGIVDIVVVREEKGDYAISK